MKIGRNDPCHCGSGQKYKKCCVTKDEAAQAAERAALAAARAAAAAEAAAEDPEGEEARNAAKAAGGRPPGTAPQRPKVSTQPNPTLHRRRAV